MKGSRKRARALPLILLVPMAIAVAGAQGTQPAPAVPAAIPGTAPASPPAAIPTPAAEPGRDVKKPWVYQSRRPDVWARAQPLLQGAPKDLGKILKLKSNDPLEAGELRLIAVEALAKLGLPLAAQAIASGVIARDPAGSPTQKALAQIAELLHERVLDEEALERQLLFLDVVIEPEDAAAMAAFFRWRALNSRRMTEWAQRALTAVPPASVWRADVDYVEAVASVAKGDVEAALGSFEKIATGEAARKVTRQMARLQWSRLLFERGEYGGAFKSYQILELPLRERGRALLEMAWSQYYLKNYAEALGILYALRNPVFAPSRSPERYILEMLILRDLCHYQKVRWLDEAFRSEYAKVYRAIEAREPLEKNERIASLALLETRLQRSANLINDLRHELARLKTLDFGDKELQAEVTAAHAKREADLRFELDRAIRQNARRIADQLLDQREQVKFIGYSATIQSKASGAKSTYEAPHIPALNYETLYWPVRNKEFWWDEISYYRAQVENLCAAEERAP